MSTPASTRIGQSMSTPPQKTSATAEGGSKKAHSYKSLRTQFQHGGCDYRQIDRKGDFAIYKQTWLSCAEPSRSYEVIRIRRRDGFRIGRRFVEPAEVYPPSEAWGVDGFTVTDGNKAWATSFEISL